MPTTKNCEYCGEPFIAMRSTRRFCSDKHKTYALRRKKDPGIGNPERRRRRDYIPNLYKQIRHGLLEPGRLTRGVDLDTYAIYKELGLYYPGLPGDQLVQLGAQGPKELRGRGAHIGHDVERLPSGDNVEREVAARLESGESASRLFIPEAEWPRHWRVAAQRSVALIGFAAKVLYLAKIHGLEHEHLRVVNNARKILLDPNRLLPRALVLDLERWRESSDYRRRMLIVRRVLLAAVNEPTLESKRVAEIRAEVESAPIQRLSGTTTYT